MDENQVQVGGGQLLQEPPNRKLAVKITEICRPYFGCEEQIFSPQSQLWQRHRQGGGYLLVVTVEICRV